jgi:serine/threonine protein kinase
LPPDQEQLEQIAEKWGQEARTIKKMNERCRDHIVRFITAFTRGSPMRGISYYLMFEWADGGSLEDLWSATKNPVLSGEMVHEAVTQIHGLIEALNATHNQANNVGTRHGDLKPENILYFKGGPGSMFGTLKIGDWGLAKYHNTATHLRIHATTTNWGTTRYEPPEFIVPVNGKRIMGRLYDIWSLGCVLLEFVIWLLYGYNEINRFRETLENMATGSATCYKLTTKDGNLLAVVHELVVSWLTHMKYDPSCAKDTALGKLLNLIEDRLLVVDLPPSKGSTVYLPDWEPQQMRGLVEQSPQIIVTRAGDSDVRSGLPAQLYRATSQEIKTYLEKGILDDEEHLRSGDFWYRDPPAGYRRQPPPGIAPKAAQDASGHLMTSEGQVNELSGAGIASSRGKRLAPEELKIVSTRAFIYPATTTAREGTDTYQPSDCAYRLEWREAVVELAADHYSRM